MGYYNPMKAIIVIISNTVVKITTLKMKYEMNGAYVIFNEHEEVEVSYEELNYGDEGNGGSHISHHGDLNNLRYDFLSSISYELFA